MKIKTGTASIGAVIFAATSIAATSIAATFPDASYAAKKIDGNTVSDGYAAKTPGTASGSKANVEKPKDGAKTPARLPNGLYLVVRENDERSKLEPLAKTELSLINDYHFLEPSAREKPSYIVVNTEDYIPFVISDAPVKDKTADGKPKLSFQLAPSQRVPLEEFTAKNCGKNVAIVIGGEVVTAHKVRTPIKDGRFQISYCSGNGCNVLYSMLQDESSERNRDNAN